MCLSQLLTCVSQHPGPYRSSSLHHRQNHYWTFIYLIFLQVYIIYGETWECPPKDQSVPVGSNVTLCCIWKKEVGVLWTVNNKIFIRNTILSLPPENKSHYHIIENGKFMIINVTAADDTNYGCSSFVGDTTKSGNIKLNVLLPPGEPSITGRRLYKEGDRTQLTCTSVGGKPPPRLYWVSNNQNYSDRTILTGDQSSIALNIEVNRTFNGQQIACLAENSVNKNNPAETRTTLNVQYAPSVRITPNYNPYKVIEGTSTKLTCHIDANPRASSASFWKGQTQVQSAILSDLNAGKFSYTIPRVNSTMTGLFKCKATNSISSGEGTLSFEVLFKPRLSLPSKVVVNITDPVQFECSANGNPKPKYVTWISPHGVTTHRPSPSVARLNIAAASKSNAGIYTCESANSMLPSEEDAVINAKSIADTTLYVQYAPGKVRVISNSIPIKGEAPVSLTCQLDPKNTGYPPPTYIWRKEGQVYQEGNSSPNLTIQKPSLTDKGYYTCTAKNLMGRSNQGSIDIDVKELPEILTGLSRSMIKNEKDRIAPLICVASGNPAPTIIWRKDGELVSGHNYKVQSSSNNSVVTSLLYFESPSQDNSNRLMPFDTGNYSCVVKTSLTNQFERISTLSLIIKSAPFMKEAQKIIAISLKTNSEFFIDVEAYPKPRFYWRKDNQPISVSPVTTQIDINTFRSSIIFPYTVPDNLGIYICFVNNTIGGMTATRDVRKISVPDPPKELASIDATWESVYLRWTPGFNGGENQTFFIYKTTANSGQPASVLEVPVGKTNTPHFNVTGLMPNAIYNFTVRGSNKLGNGFFSNYFAMQTQSLNFPMPLNVKYYESTKLVKFKVNSEYNCCASLRIDQHISLWCNTTLFSMTNNTLKIGYTNVLKLEVKLCLRQRTDLCGSYVTAEKVNTKMSETPLSTTHMIIIAVVCSLILIVLVVVLILFLYWRNKSQKKQYGNEVNYPHIPNGRVGNGMPNQQVYDNPDGPYANGYIENKHNTSSEHTDELPPYTDNDIGHELSDESDPEKPYDTYRNDNLSFYSHPQSPTRNMNFVSLNPDGLPRETSTSGRESGYSTPDSSRPKKVIYEVIV